MKKTLAALICFFIIFVTQLSLNAATHDASGWWDVNYDIYITGTGMVLSGQYYKMYVEQYADDTFALTVDGTTYTYWQGDITNNHYSVTSCNWEEWIPIASSFPGHDDTGFFISYIDPPMKWGIVDTTTFSFDLSSSTGFSGEWHWTMSGWVTDEPDLQIAMNDPDLWYYHAPYNGISGYWDLSGSKVPNPEIPTVSEWGITVFFILLVGSALWVMRRRTDQESV